jgi:hypothetical protein
MPKPMWKLHVPVLMPVASQHETMCLFNMFASVASLSIVCTYAIAIVNYIKGYELDIIFHEDDIPATITMYIMLLFYMI